MTVSIIDVLTVYEWLMCYLCIESHKKVDQEMIKKKVSSTTAMWHNTLCLHSIWAVCIALILTSISSVNDDTLDLIMMPMFIRHCAFTIR